MTSRSARDVVVAESGAETLAADGVPAGLGRCA